MLPEHPSWVAVPSPNFRAGRPTPVKGIVVHYTAAGAAKSSADYFSRKTIEVKDAKGRKTQRAVNASAHFVIERDGTVYQCVHLGDRAWHAGDGWLWKGAPKPAGSNVNDFTVGIELANWGPLTQTPTGPKTYVGRPYVGPQPFVDAKGGLWEPFPAAQMAACALVVQEVVRLFPSIQAADILAHSDVSPRRKQDTGPAFDLAQLRFMAFQPVVPVIAAHKEPLTDSAEVIEALAQLSDSDREGFYDHDAEMCLDPNGQTLV